MILNFIPRHYGQRHYQKYLPYKQRVTGSNPVAPTLKIKELDESLTPFLFLFAHNLHTETSLTTSKIELSV